MREQIYKNQTFVMNKMASSSQLHLFALFKRPLRPRSSSFLGDKIQPKQLINPSINRETEHLSLRKQPVFITICWYHDVFVPLTSFHLSQITTFHVTHKNFPFHIFLTKIKNKKCLFPNQNHIINIGTYLSKSILKRYLKLTVASWESRKWSLMNYALRFEVHSLQFQIPTLHHYRFHLV